jgi:hypothetical protein
LAGASRPSEEKLMMNQQFSGYGAPPQSPGGYGPPPAQPAYGANPYGGYAPPPPMAAPMPMASPAAAAANAKNPGLAVLFELLGGTFLQTFGIGHIYAGNVGVGLAFMFGYWALTALNFFLCFLFIGFITWPICWLAAMIVSSILASGAAKKFNRDKLGLPG